MQSCLYPIFQYQSFHFLLSPSFPGNCHNRQVRINKMINKDTVDYHPSPSQSILRMWLLIFLWTPKGVYLSRIFLKFLTKTVYSIKFQIYSLKITSMFIFTHAPNQNSPPGFYHYTLGIIITHSSQQRFLRYFSLSRKREERITKLKKLLKFR